MPDVLLPALGALALAVVQAIGLALIWLCGEDHREARSWWYALTGWLVWLGPYMAEERRRRRAYLARQKRAPAPQMSEKWRQMLDDPRGDDA
jgi:hypothetical protein